MNKEELRALLDRYGVPYGDWKTKTIDDLHRDLESGEAQLVEEDGKLVWATVAAGVDVWHYDYGNQGKTWFLVEDRQEYANGETVSRAEMSGASIMEKMRPKEDPRDAAVRAIQEELGYGGEIHFDMRHMRRPNIPLTPSRTYPGLYSRYKISIYRWNMPRAHFKPDGYVEAQPKKKTFFMWQERQLN